MLTVKFLLVISAPSGSGCSGTAWRPACTVFGEAVRTVACRNPRSLTRIDRPSTRVGPLPPLDPAIPHTHPVPGSGPIRELPRTRRHGAGPKAIIAAASHYGSSGELAQRAVEVGSRNGVGVDCVVTVECGPTEPEEQVARARQRLARSPWATTSIPQSPIAALSRLASGKARRRARPGGSRSATSRPSASIGRDGRTRR